jgi:hypothetical protein
MAVDEQQAPAPDPERDLDRIDNPEQHMKGLLKGTLRPPWNVAINNRQETVTGRALSNGMTDRLDISAFARPPYLTEQQTMILVLMYGPDDLTQQEVADRLNTYRSTVSRQRHDAIETLIRIYFQRPDYVLPWRVYSTQGSRECDADGVREMLEGR